MKITTLEIAGLESAIMGMRLPMMSRDKSDSGYTSVCTHCLVENYSCGRCGDIFTLGENDLNLAKRLVKAGSEHHKFTRMIQVWADVDMPRYWWQEADTYKFGTKNSESTMHTIMKKPVTIDDFEVDEKIKEILRGKVNNKRNFIYKCELKKGEKELLKTFEVNGYEYVISNTGQIWAKEKYVEYKDGRNRFYPMKLLKISQNSNDYYSVRLGGRKGKLYMVHRLIAENFIENKEGFECVNHIDGDKGNCSVYNLEWCTQKHNNQHAVDNGLKIPTEYLKYKAYITNKKLNSSQMKEIKERNKNGESQKSLALEFDVSQSTISEIIRGERSEYAELYEEANVWEKIIERINELRLLYIETKDYNYIVRLKRILPEGFLQLRTWNTNYAELRNMVKQRINHRLKEEWQDVFVGWVKTLPYAEELIFYGL